MKIVHAADLHVDSALRGLERYDGAPTEHVRDATRTALVKLVDLCVEERASLLLLAGDVFDGTWRDYNTGLFFVSQLGRLRDLGARVALIRGNHDAASSVVKNLRWPEHVRELASSAPETVLYEDLGVAVHGQSFATRAVTEDLARRYPAPLPGLLNVGLLHTALDGRPGHDPYAPTQLATLSSKGYDYWALGHVHEREVLASDPWIVFPGNLQGRHARETGPKGATVVTVDEGRVRTVEHRVLDVVRWSQIHVEHEDAASIDDAAERAIEAITGTADAADGRILAARVHLRVDPARGAALFRDPDRLTAEIRRAALDRHGEDVYVERVLLAPAARATAGGGLSALASGAVDDATLAALEGELAELRRKLPRDLVEGADRLDLTIEGLRALVPEAEALLAARLEGSDEA